MLSTAAVDFVDMETEYFYAEKITYVAALPQYGALHRYQKPLSVWRYLPNCRDNSQMCSLTLDFPIAQHVL